MQEGIRHPDFEKLAGCGIIGSAAIVGRQNPRRNIDPMNEKEIAELRRRFRQDKSSITHVRGCYVNENREIISEFDQSLTLSRQEDAEKILKKLKIC